jgi:hypothetical protein
MKVVIEANNRMVYILLSIIAVLLILNLISPLLKTSDLVANGVPDRPEPVKVRVFKSQDKPFAINLNEYPNVHIFRTDGDQVHCLGMVKIDEKKKTYSFESYQEEGGAPAPAKKK